jgi:integrase
MSRRSGQVGSLVRKGNMWRVRFMLDVPGDTNRRYKSVFVAPVSGPGSLTKPELQRRAMEIVVEAGANSEVTLRRAEGVTFSPTFRQQAALWLDEAQNRKRKPVKPHTLANWVSELRWINKQIGDTPLSAVNNKLVKEEIVAAMADDEYAPKTISNYVTTIQQVVASALDDNGEELYPVKWNHRFMDMPDIVDQRRPVYTSADVNAILKAATGKDAILFALLAGTGLRIGEALALQVDDVKDGFLSITKSLFSTTLQTPKTANGKREVDLHSSLELCVRSFIGARSSGFIFHNGAGASLHQSNILRHLHTILKSTGRETSGFHAFRRFRITFLRNNRVPERYIKFWLGHAGTSVTDRYDMVAEDRVDRRLIAEQVGLGFDPPEARKPVVSPYCPQSHPEKLLVSV